MPPYSPILTSNIQKLEFILQNANHKPGCILKNIVDKQVVKPLVDAIIREYDTRDIYNQDLIQQYVNAMIVLVARNIAKFLHLELSGSTDQRAANILKFIQANIYHPDKYVLSICASNSMYPSIIWASILNSIPAEPCKDTSHNTGRPLSRTA